MVRNDAGFREDGNTIGEDWARPADTQLEANRKDYAERVQTIQQIGQSRRLWSKFCDELLDRKSVV